MTADDSASRPNELSCAPLGRSAKACIFATVALLALLAIRHLPPGICFGDSGGLQLAATTLGIMHPPGYAGYASLCFPFTLMPRVDPAFAVTLVCFGAGLGVALLGMMWQVRLGVAAPLACASVLILAAQPRYWINLCTPEVYMLTLLLVVSTGYALMRFGQTGRRRSLLIAAVCLGLAIANRPPILLMCPGFALAGWVAWRRHRGAVAHPARLGLVVIACLIAPVVYQFGYLWFRDTPTTPLNYIEQYNAETGLLPSADGGLGAKFTRVAWLMTARQFSDSLDPDSAFVSKTLTRRIPGELTGNRLIRFVSSPLGPVGARLMVWIGLLVAAYGTVVIARHDPCAAWSLTGMLIGGVVYVSIYRVQGDAADTLPVIFALTIMCATALSQWLRRLGCVWHVRVGVGLLILLGAFTVADGAHRREPGRAEDATAFLAKLDLSSLPSGSVICCGWKHATPLWYAQHVALRRGDLHIINADARRWEPMADRYDGPVFSTTPFAANHHTLTRFRNVWRWTPK